MNLLRRMTLAIKQDFAYTRRSEKGVQNPTERWRPGAAVAGTSPCL